MIPHRIKSGVEWVNLKFGKQVDLFWTSTGEVHLQNL
jgi:hypothetical protein